MERPSSRVKRWAHAWLHSDLIGIPLTLAVVGIIVISVGLYQVLGNVGGLFVGKLLFILSLGGLLTLILMLEGRRGETTEAVSSVAADAPRRVLVIANEGLQNPALCAQICAGGRDTTTEALIVSPVVASSRLHALADDIDVEMRASQARVDTAVQTLRSAGITASGHVDIGQPMSCLIDGLREFPATEVLMLRDGEAGWDDAQQFAERVRAEIGVPVTELETTEAALADRRVTQS